MTYDIVNPGPGFGEPQHGGGVKSVGYLTSCGNYFVHIEYENKFNNIQKLYRNKGTRTNDLSSDEHKYILC